MTIGIGKSRDEARCADATWLESQTVHGKSYRVVLNNAKSDSIFRRIVLLPVMLRQLEEQHRCHTCNPDVPCVRDLVADAFLGARSILRAVACVARVACNKSGASLHPRFSCTDARHKLGVAWAGDECPPGLCASSWLIASNPAIEFSLATFDRIDSCAWVLARFVLGDCALAWYACKVAIA